MSESEPSDEHLGIALRARRPAPTREFGMGLRERLVALHARASRPEHLWGLVATYAGSGLVLLALAALGASGSGPFGS